MDNLLEYFSKEDGIVDAQIEGFRWRENARLLEDDVLVDEIESILPYCDQLEIDVLPIILNFHKDGKNLSKEDRKVLESTYILISSKYLIDVENGDLVVISPV